MTLPGERHVPAALERRVEQPGRREAVQDRPRRPPGPSRAPRACRPRPRACGRRAACRAPRRAPPGARKSVSWRREARSRGSSRGPSRPTATACGSREQRRAARRCRRRRARPPDAGGCRAPRRPRSPPAEIASAIAARLEPGADRDRPGRRPRLARAPSSSAAGSAHASRCAWVSITRLRAATRRAGRAAPPARPTRRSRLRPQATSAPRQVARLAERRQDPRRRLRQVRASATASARSPSTSRRASRRARRARSGSFASCHGARSSTWRLSARTSCQISSSAPERSKRSIRAATSCAQAVQQRRAAASRPGASGTSPSR